MLGLSPRDRRPACNGLSRSLMGDLNDAVLAVRKAEEVPDGWGGVV